MLLPEESGHLPSRGLSSRPNAGRSHPDCKAPSHPAKSRILSCFPLVYRRVRQTPGIPHATIFPAAAAAHSAAVACLILASCAPRMASNWRTSDLSKAIVPTAVPLWVRIAHRTWPRAAGWRGSIGQSAGPTRFRLLCRHQCTRARTKRMSCTRG
jgi:hypothetical protein